MKKVFVFMFLMILLVGTVSSFDFDNVKTYDDMNKEVTITNFFGIGDTISKIKLNTPIVYKVMRGKDRLVAEFTIESYLPYSDAFNKMEFYDVNEGMKKIDRKFVYKYKKYYDVMVPDYITKCKELVSINGSVYKECIKIKSGEHIEKRFTWELFDSKTKITSGNITIGVFTDVLPNERVEWIPTLFGVRVEEWATWTESLNEGLYSYWKFDETSGTNSKESVYGVNNGTISGATVGVAGKINYSYDFDGVNDYVSMGWDMSGFSNGTMSVWVKPTINGNTMYIAGESTAGFDIGDWFWYIDSSGYVIWQTEDASSQYSITSDSPLTNESWSHIVVQWGVGGMKMYVNGTLQSTNQTTTQGLVGTNWKIGANYRDGAVSSYYEGLIDEFSIWNRSVTSNEVTNLYNNGDGVTYSPTIYPEVILNFPEDNKKTNDTTITFNCTSYANTSILNISLLINNEINYTVTNSTTTENLSLETSVPLSYGDYNWSCKSSDENGAEGASSVRTISISKVALQSVTYNSSTYETATEKFIANISSNSSLTAVKLVYNGTEYPATQSGEIWTRTLSLTSSQVGTNTFYWKYTYAGDTITSDNYTQTVDSIDFGICNSTLNTPYINFTFKDESDNSDMNASIPNADFTYYLGSDASVNKTYNYINNTNNPSYAFCFSPTHKTINLDMSIQYKNGTTHPQRTYQTLRSLTNQTTNQTLYLLSSTEGIYVTFQVINGATTQPISNVFVNATRTIDGGNEIVGSGYTDTAGTITFWLNPDFTHTLTFSKTGYETYTTSLTPTQSSYTISLGGETTDSATNYYRGMVIRISPTLDFLTNNTLYNFTLDLSSTYWTLDEFGFSLYYGDGSLINSISSNADKGEVLTISDVNVSGDVVYLTYYFIVNGTTINSGSARLWGIDTEEGTEFSINYLFEDLNTYLSAGMFGADDFFRVLISFVFLVMVVGSISYNFGIKSEAAVFAIMWATILFLDVGVGMLPALKLGDRLTISHFYSYLITLLLAGMIFKEGQK